MILFCYMMPLDHTHQLYAMYHSMKQRCSNRNHPRYMDWGGQGIRVCDRWTERVTGFSNFLADMGERPEGYLLARIDTRGHYEPSNCQWVSPSRNSYGRRVKSTNQSGITGVYFNKRQNKWHSTITINRKRVHLGWFVDFSEAVDARILAEVRFGF